MTTDFVYDGSTPIAEETYSGTSAKFSALNGWTADGWRARYAASESPAVAYQFLYDAQGNLVERQNANTYGFGRAAYDRSLYEGYGALRSDTLLSNSVSGGVATSPHDPAGFGGQFGYYTDVETGLLCLTHRYYDPGTGKFINRDPIGYAGGANLYGFADGNPVNESDPSGTQNQTNQYPGLPPPDDSTNSNPYIEYTKTGELNEHPSVAEVLSGKVGKVSGKRLLLRRSMPGSGDAVVELFEAEIKSLARNQAKRAKQAAFLAQAEALAAPLKPAEILANRAAALGYTQRRPPQPFSHGQAVFSNGRNFISRDIDAHNVTNGWKMFNRRGVRLGTYDSGLNRVGD